MKKKRRGGGGRDPKIPVRATKNVVVRARVGKEFPDMGPSEREIKFIRVSGPAQERADVEWGSLVLFYTQCSGVG